jgi:hypothetical protein
MSKENTTTPDQSPTLVTTSISQTDTLELYPESLKVKRPNSGNQKAEPPLRTGKLLDGFSSKSRSRLRFQAMNAFPHLVSQLGLTYHNQWPTDGRECKRHLNLFLTHARKLLPEVNYLWIMEFQKRNAPHFHVFLTIPPDADLHFKLASIWTNITSPNDKQALDFHCHPDNWILWIMNKANYLTKYLDKDAQKSIPHGYFNFGRFWGASRNLVSPPIVIDLNELDNLESVNTQTGETDGGQIRILRQLGRLAEKQTNGFSKFRIRAPHGSYTMLQGTKAYLQLENYYRRLKT